MNELKPGETYTAAEINLGLFNFSFNLARFDVLPPRLSGPGSFGGGLAEFLGVHWFLLSVLTFSLNKGESNTFG